MYKEKDDVNFVNNYNTHDAKKSYLRTNFIFNKVHNVIV